MKIPGLALTVHVHDDVQQLAVAVAARIAVIAKQAIAARGVFYLALAGGETPRVCYEKLRHVAIDWAHVQVYFGDERCLPRGDARRNDSMAHDCLLDQIAIPPENIHGIAAELGADAAAALYRQELCPRLDLVLLGVGEDGHTASLFPGNPATGSPEAVVPVYSAPKFPAERVSLGLGALNFAREKLFLVAGEGKQSVMARILLGETLPAAQIINAEWYLDRSALPTTT